jgi:cell division protein FtsB
MNDKIAPTREKKRKKRRELIVVLVGFFLFLAQLLCYISMTIPYSLVIENFLL